MCTPPGVSKPQPHCPFVVSHSKHLAKRITEQKGSQKEQVELAYKLLFSRTPDQDEVRLAKNFLSVEDGVQLQQRWQQYAQLLLISNEMMYLD